MTFRTAIVETPGPDSAEGLTAAGLGPPDLSRLLAQHQAYVRALKAIGLDVVVLPPAYGYPDAYFVEDAAVVTPEVAVIARPGAPSRRGEERFVEPVLAEYRKLARIEAPGTLDGGDVLSAGNRFFIGVSERTNENGARQLGRILERHGHAWTTVQVAGGLHLKSGVNGLGGDRLILTPAWAGHEAFRRFRTVVTPPGEEYAANTLQINGRLLTPAGFPGVRALLRRLGLPVIELETSEIRKMDGGLTCLSLRF